MQSIYKENNINIIPELSLVKLFTSYKLFQEYGKYVNKIYLKNNFPELARIYESLATFFAANARDTTVEELHVWFLTRHPQINDREREVFDALFSTILLSNTSSESLLSMVKSIRQRENLQALAVQAYEASEGRASIEAIEASTKQLLESAECSTEQLTPVKFVSDNLEELYNEAVATPGLRWRLKSLNSSLGSLRKGDFGFVFARPETGKTTFLASEITQMAMQVASPVLWFNNEEQGSKVMLRCYQATLGLRLEQLLSNIKKHQEEFHKLTKGNIKIYDQAIISKNEVEQICETFQPSLVIFDQIDKLSGFAADRNDLQLGEIYNFARELSKRFCPVIGVCQADGTGEGQKWLTMANVANAKTSKQAEADWILGIGRSNDDGYENVRHFNISKNKLLGDKDTVAELRHNRWDVHIEPSMARYEDFTN